MTPQRFHEPRVPCDPRIRRMCEATIRARDDVRRIWWLTVEYTDAAPSTFQDELHVELLEPPGANGAGREFFRDFAWATQPVGQTISYTFTPRSLLAAVGSVAELVAEQAG